MTRRDIREAMVQPEPEEVELVHPPTVGKAWDETKRGQRVLARGPKLEKDKIELEKQINKLSHERAKERERQGYFPTRSGQFDEMLESKEIELQILVRDIETHEANLDLLRKRWVANRVADYPKRIHEMREHEKALELQLADAVKKQQFDEANRLKTELDNVRFDREILERDWLEWTDEPVPQPREVS